jgi:hypothetical protein
MDSRLVIQGAQITAQRQGCESAKPKGAEQPLRAWYVRKEYAIMRVVLSKLSTQEDMAMVMSKTTSKAQTTIPKEIRIVSSSKSELGWHSSRKGIGQLRMAEKE